MRGSLPPCALWRTLSVVSASFLWLALPLVSVAAGFGWYFSSVLLRPDRSVRYPDRVRAVLDRRVWLARSRWAEQPGRWGLRWADGLAVVGPVSTGGADGQRSDAVCRPLIGGQPPPPGAQVVFEAGVYDPDPSVHGLDFVVAPVPTSLGTCPAWFVPPADRDAASDTWAITVHGRGADRRECLRVLPCLHQLGYPVLAISYRNDVGAPASPDGYYHLGDTEWHDLASAADYVLGTGARRLVLFGWSMGAAIVGAYLDRAPTASSVAAVVWDSPVLDWRATLRRQAAVRKLPAMMAALAAMVTRARIGIDFDRFDLARRPPSVRPPTLLFHGTHDTAVPIEPARALAAVATELSWPLRYIQVPEAEHTASWNVDPDNYQRMIAEFLMANAAPTPQPARWHDGRRE